MPKLSIYLPQDVITDVMERAEPDAQDPRQTTGASTAVKNSLERYFTLLKIERRALRKLFTAPECAVIVAATNGTLECYPSMIPASPSCVLDACHFEDGKIVACDGLIYHEPLSIDRAEFKAKLQSLTPGQAFAFVDACERYWSSPTSSQYDRLFEENQSVGATPRGCPDAAHGGPDTPEQVGAAPCGSPEKETA